MRRCAPLTARCGPAAGSSSRPGTRPGGRGSSGRPRSRTRSSTSPAPDAVESWEEVVDVSGDLVTFRSMTVFRRDDIAIESMSTLRFRPAARSRRRWWPPGSTSPMSVTRPTGRAASSCSWPATRAEPRLDARAKLAADPGADGGCIHGCVGGLDGRRAVDRDRRAELWPGARVPRRRGPARRVADEPRRGAAVRLGVGGRHGARSVHGHVAVPPRDVGEQALRRPRAEAARGPRRAAGADRRRRRLPHELLDAGRPCPRSRRRGPGGGQPAPDLRRPARLRLRRRAAVLRVPGVGSEPGAARRARRADRVPGPGAGRDRHDRPAGLLRRAARDDGDPHRARAPRPHRRGHGRRHRPVRDDGVQPRAAAPRPLA